MARKRKEQRLHGWVQTAAHAQFLCSGLELQNGIIIVFNVNWDICPVSEAD